MEPRKFPHLPDEAQNPGHWWSGFPGAYCMKCGASCAIEQAIADGWYDPYDEKWDTIQHQAEVQLADGTCKADTAPPPQPVAPPPPNGNLI